MKTEKLMNRLKSCEWLCHELPECDLYSCRLLPDDEPFSDNTLYLCTPSGLTAGLAAGEGIGGKNFLCFCDGSAGEREQDISLERFHGCNLARVQGPASIALLLKEVEGIMTDDVRLTDNISRLLRILHSNFGIQALIDAAYDILGNPILLVDSSFKILASCLNVIEDRPDLAAQQAYGYVLDANIQAIQKARLYEKARRTRYPVYNKETAAKEGWITALVYIHGIESAHIAVSDSNCPFTEDDFELIDYLCQFVSIELQKSDFYRANESMMHSFFLSELLNNEIRDMPTILRRAQSLNWNLTEYLRVMTVFQAHSEVFDKKAQLISKQIHKLLPNSHWVIHDGHIVFLLCLKNTDPSEFRGENELCRYLENNRLSASLSRCFHSLTDTKQFYKESLAAYQFGQRFKPEDSLYIYTDYLCLHIGGILAERYTLSNFYHPAIEKIKVYDEEHHTALLATLKEYLTHPDNPGMAARNLFIHKNTLFYRMAKLKELFSLDLSSGEERLMLHLSLKFMELD